MSSSNAIKYFTTDERAVQPVKAHDTDIGYDLTAIDVFKRISPDITLFETGIIVSCSEGYYIEILPRSSISKSGYMLANSVGIIDPSYRGSLKIAFIKIDKSIPDIKLPFTLCQIVVRKIEKFSIERVSTQAELYETENCRGDGGFGSSNKNKSLKEIGGHSESSYIENFASMKITKHESGTDDNGDLHTIGRYPISLYDKLNMSLNQIIDYDVKSRDDIENYDREFYEQTEEDEQWNKLTDVEKRKYLDAQIDDYINKNSV